MIRDIIKSDKKRHLTVIGSTAAITLLVASIVVVGVAQSSYAQQQQQQLRIARGFITSFMIADNTIVSADLKDGAAVRSEDIVDGEVKNQDLAPDAIASDKIANGEVKAEDLDPGIELGGGGETPSLSLQVTERSNSVTSPAPSPSGFPSIHLTVSVQCNSDEVVTGGGFTLGPMGDTSNVLESKKMDNGWTTTWKIVDANEPLEVHAECLKIVEERSTG